MRRNDKLSADVMRGLLAGWLPARIAADLGKPRSSIYGHMKTLIKDGAIIKDNGHWKPGRGAIRYQDSNPTPSAQRVAAKPDSMTRPDIPIWRVENARFRIDLPPGSLMPVRLIIGNGTRTWRKEYHLRDNLSCTVQTWHDKTAMASLSKFHIHAKLIPYLNQYLMSIGFDAMWTFARDAGIRLPIDAKPIPLPDKKAKDAEMPLITGELCRPLPMQGVSRIQVGPTEINNSPPGLSKETSDIMDAYVDAFSSQRIIGLEKGVTSILSMLERHEKAFLTFAEAMNRQMEVFTKLTESLNQFVNPPPRETVGRIGGYL